MPTTPATGVWVEYERAGNTASTPARILRPHKNKIAALESAVESMNGAIEVPFGSTLEEALAAKDAPTTTRRGAVVREDSPGDGIARS